LHDVAVASINRKTTFTRKAAGTGSFPNGMLSSSIPGLNKWSILGVGVKIFPHRRENFNEYRIFYGIRTVFRVTRNAPTVSRVAVVDLVLNEQPGPTGHQISGLLVRMAVSWNSRSL
jgi:hypothetical protein